MTLLHSGRPPQEAWAPFLYTAKIRHSQDGGTTTRRYMLRDTVPVEPIEITFADLRPVVRFHRLSGTDLPFSRDFDEVYVYQNRLYREFTLKEGGWITPAATFEKDTRIARQWEAFMVAMVPGAPWNYAQLATFPLLQGFTIEEQSQAGKWTRWRVIESDHAHAWAETHARYRGSVLVCEDAVLVETMAPTWFVAPHGPVYNPTRPWRTMQRCFQLDALDDVAVFMGLPPGAKPSVGGTLDLRDLPAGNFDRSAVEIAITALGYAVELGQQTSSAERATAGVTAPYDRLRLLYRRKIAPSAAEAEGILADAERLHAALSPIYRSRRYFLPRATRFMTEARLRFTIEHDKASRLSDEDMAALAGL